MGCKLSPEGVFSLCFFCILLPQDSGSALGRFSERGASQDMVLAVPNPVVSGVIANWHSVPMTEGCEA